jgi:hypothetical protein
MSRVKKTALALSVLFSLGFLSLGLFTNRTLPWTSQYVPPLLNAASHIDARTVKLHSPSKADDRFVIESYAESTPPSGVFLAAQETVEISRRRFVVSPLFLRTNLAPKVSRDLSKSVLII